MKITTRKEIRSLHSDELLALRSAMLKYQNSGGFVDLAGFHGIPQKLCQHGNDLFLPWHRAYISTFEKALQAIDPVVSLPYWDWTSADSQQHGMPAAFTDNTFVDTDGQTKRNPLLSGPCQDVPRLTVRHTDHTTDQVITAAGGVPPAQIVPDFQNFSAIIDGPHMSIHSYVGGAGGDMSSFARAAFDPMFWSHHAMVDFQWAQWQINHPDAPMNDLDMAFPEFNNIRVRDVLDTTSPLLNYTYARLSEVAGNIRYTRIKLLRINDILMGEESFIVDVYLCWKGMEKPVHAGRFGIIGMGMKMGHGHTPMGHKPMFYQQHINVTDLLDKNSPPTSDIKVELVGVNMKGEKVPQSTLGVGKIEFIDL
jgi:hypothetical protein